jgi:Protein of unknown function (DUF1572)
MKIRDGTFYLCHTYIKFKITLFTESIRNDATLNRMAGQNLKLYNMDENNYLESAKNQFTQYKTLGEKAMAQVPEEKLYWQYNPETNSIAIIVKHLTGNMLSRFTDFLTSDGEKKWRNRDAEFENEPLTRDALYARWNQGWDCLFLALNALSAGDLSKPVLIRHEEHSVLEAINRQLTHYASHVGQIIFISKMIADSQWKSLTIPRNASAVFNAKKGL